MSEILERTAETPVGRLLLRADAIGLVEIRFGAREIRTAETEILMRAERELRAYFSGELREFDVPLHPSGTEFRMRVWNELRAVPYGTTVTYGELARRIGQPNAARAVGMANHANPLPIIVPCHRVIGADGSLTGYAGGLEIKRKLLEVEKMYTEFPLQY